MPIGPGKYDDLCTYVRETAKAKGAIVIVVEGEKGEGFECQADIMTTIKLPGLLRYMADQIEESLKKGQLL